MAQLDQLRPLFDEMSEEEQVAYVASYRRQRDVELESSVPVKKGRAKTEPEGPELSPEQKALLKKLGIKKADLLRLLGGSDGAD